MRKKENERKTGMMIREEERNDAVKNSEMVLITYSFRKSHSYT